MENHEAHVVIVGAGPTGLLLAAELALAHVEVVVLERLREASSTIKAGSINVASAELLDRRGLLPELQASQRRTLTAMRAFAQTARGGRSWSTQLETHEGRTERFPVTGHFAGMLFRTDLVDQTDPVLSGHAAVADGTLVPQRDVEAVLARWTARLGVQVHRGVEVTGLRSDGSQGLEDADRDVILSTDAGEWRAGWVIGTDGGRSTVRKAAGIGFPGTEPETTGYQAIVDLDRPDLLRPGWTWTPHGVYSYGPIPGRILMVQFTGAPRNRDEPVGLEELQASIRLVSATDVTLTALHGEATRWTDNTRQAERYRSGRVLLAGDAAHVHSPFSGQGLNLGLGDASNLGWKLAATVRGRAPDGLLDTYESERHPIGAQVLNWTRAQVALMRGDAKTEQLRHVVEDQLLATRDTATRIVAYSSGVAQEYRIDSTAAGDPTPVGRLLEEQPLRGGGRLTDEMTDGRPVLLDRTEDGSIAARAAGWGGRVRSVRDPDPTRRPLGLFVRPDGVVAWAADSTDPGEIDGLVPALERWVGRPDRPA